MPHYHIIVHGDVQGVGFRYYTLKNAMLYGVAGWVRNKFNGTVEIEAEGKEDALAGFIRQIKAGSRFSCIKSVAIEQSDEIKDYKTFEIIGDE